MHSFFKSFVFWKGAKVGRCVTKSRVQECNSATFPRDCTLEPWLSERGIMTADQSRLGFSSKPTPRRRRGKPTSGILSQCTQAQFADFRVHLTERDFCRCDRFVQLAGVNTIANIVGEI